MTTPGDAYRSLPPTAEVGGLRDRHLEFFRSFARRARDAEFGRERDIWIELLESELDNLRAALTWSLESRDAEAAMDLAASCVCLWRDGRWTEGRSWLGRALSVRAAPTPQRVRALLAAASVARYAERERLAAEAVELARATGDRPLLVTALARLGTDQCGRSRWDEATASFEAALAEADDDAACAPGVADALRGLGQLALELDGNVARAREFYERARSSVSAPDLQGWLVGHLGLYANFAWQVGDLAGAERLYGEKLELESASGLAASRADTLLNLADVKESLQLGAEARTLLCEVDRLGREAGNLGDCLRAKVRLAGLDFRMGDLESATVRLDEAQSIIDATPDAVDQFPNNLPVVLYLRSWLAQHRGDVVEAERLLQGRLSVVVARPLAHAIARVPLAHLASRSGAPERAKALLREAVELLEQEPERLKLTRPVLGLLAEEEGDLDRAWDLYEAGRVRRHDEVFPMELASACAGMARLAVRRRDIDAVRRLAAEGLPAARLVGASEEVELWWVLARAEIAHGNVAGAVDALEHALPRWPDVGGNPTNWVELLETVAITAIGAGRGERGAELLGLADAERERIVFPRTDRARAEIEAAAEAGGAAIGVDVFDAARGRGRAMDIRTELWKEAGR